MEDAKWYFTHETEEDRLWYYPNQLRERNGKSKYDGEACPRFL